MPIGRDKVVIVDDSFKSESIDDVFVSYRAVLIDALQKSLVSVDRVSSGELYQSIRVDIERLGRVISFDLMMEDYWKFVDEGRKKGAKQPPQKAILEFIKFRGIQPSNIKALKGKNKKIKKDKAYKALAYVIARSIKKKGIKPTHFYSNVVNDNFKAKFKEDIAKAFKEDVLISVREIKEQLNG